jgi:hypothetical protein
MIGHNGRTALEIGNDFEVVAETNAAFHNPTDMDDDSRPNLTIRNLAMIRKNSETVGKMRKNRKQYLKDEGLVGIVKKTSVVSLATGFGIKSGLIQNQAEKSFFIIAEIDKNSICENRLNGPLNCI